MQTKADLPCSACAEADRFPLSGLACDGCERCLARSVSRMPTQQRQEVYRAITEPDERRAFVDRVRAAGERWRAACGQSTWEKCGGQG